MNENNVCSKNSLLRLGVGGGATIHFNSTARTSLEVDCARHLQDQLTARGVLDVPGLVSGHPSTDLPISFFPQGTHTPTVINAGIKRNKTRRNTIRFTRFDGLLKLLDGDEYLYFCARQGRVYAFQLLDEWTRLPTGFPTLSGLLQHTFTEPNHLSFDPPGLTTLHTLLTSTSFLVVPVYQRSYSWMPKQIRDLFQSVNEVAENSETTKKQVKGSDGSQVNKHDTPRYFFGPIDTQEDHGTGNDKPRTIIDGQQRIITTYCLIAVIVD